MSDVQTTALWQKHIHHSACSSDVLHDHQETANAGLSCKIYQLKAGQLQHDPRNQLQFRQKIERRYADIAAQKYFLAGCFEHLGDECAGRALALRAGYADNMLRRADAQKFIYGRRNFIGNVRIFIQNNLRINAGRTPNNIETVRFFR